jgi:hypothetical protein
MIMFYALQFLGELKICVCNLPSFKDGYSDMFLDALLGPYRVIPI